MNSILVVLDTDGSRILDSASPAITFAQELAALWSVDFDLLVLGGPNVESAALDWSRHGARTVWCAADAALLHPVADRAAQICRAVMEEAGAVALVGTASTFGKDMLPRVADLCGAAMVSDVTGIEADPGGLQFRRPMFAGNVIATVEVGSRSAVFSVRASAFGDPKPGEGASEIKTVGVDRIILPEGTTWVSMQAAARSRPDLGSARVVVSGGRPMRDAETFERLLGGLADVLHGAVGATRAAVDSGIAPNELQVGQTGKVVAPDLYIAAGISGSVQHLAGMKDSRVIVAINTDPDAPIFAVSDYGLVADLHQAVPELTEALRSAERK